MGLFDKKYCDICGNEIKFLGNRKLEDGNMCKDCASKLSPWFDDRRHTTIASIKEQLAYRQENEKKVPGFKPTAEMGCRPKIYVDEDDRQFIVTYSTNWQNENPDIISFDDVKVCDVDIRERKNEIYQKDAEGKNISYTPRRYDVEYHFNITLQLNHPYIDEISLELNDEYPESKYSDSYRYFEKQAYELKEMLTGTKTASAKLTSAKKDDDSWTCSKCNTVNTGKFCSGCGAPKADTEKWYCSECGQENTGKFCSGCGAARK